MKSATLKNRRPNILWIFCEDVCPWFGCYGDHTVTTPNIDALARRATLFTNCYSCSPVCSPSRSGVITGCMPTSIGVHHHHSGRSKDYPLHLPLGVRTLPEIFREAGYFTYNNGKDDYNFTYSREELYSGPSEWHHIYGYSGGGDWRDRKAGQPFFGQVTLWGGKNKHLPTQLISPEEVRVPPYYPDTLEFRKEYACHYNQLKVTDDEVGRLLDRLESDGLMDNTVVFFFSDHGYRLLRHKQFLYDGGIHVPLIIAGPGVNEAVVRRDLVSNIDIAATTLALAGLPVPTAMESRDVFAPDFARDFVISTRDRCDFTIDRIRSVRTQRFKYIRNFLTDRPLMQPQYRDHSPEYRQWFSMRDAGILTITQAQFLSSVRPPEEFYDLEADPDETNNLANRKELASEIELHRQILHDWIVETGDKGELPEDPGQLLPVIHFWGKRATDPVFVAARLAFGIPEQKHAPPQNEVTPGYTV